MSSPDQNFQKLITEISELCEKIHAYSVGGEDGRPWMIPSTATTGEIDKDGKSVPISIFDIKNLSAAFERSGPNQKYEEEMSKGSESTVGVCMGAKVQIDYLGMMERAFRARNASPIRCYTHAASRRKAHGDPQGVHVNSVLEFVTNLMKVK